MPRKQSFFLINWSFLSCKIRVITLSISGASLTSRQPVQSHRPHVFGAQCFLVAVLKFLTMSSLNLCLISDIQREHGLQPRWRSSHPLFCLHPANSSCYFPPNTMQSHGVESWVPVRVCWYPLTLLVSSCFREHIRWQILKGERKTPWQVERKGLWKKKESFFLAFWIRGSHFHSAPGSTNYIDGPANYI